MKGYCGTEGIVALQWPKSWWESCHCLQSVKHTEQLPLRYYLIVQKWLQIFQKSVLLKFSPANIRMSVKKNPALKMWISRGKLQFHPDYWGFVHLALD